MKFIVTDSETYGEMVEDTPPTPPQPRPKAAVLTALKASTPVRYWTTLQTRVGWSWTCTHPACERSERGGYGCRFPSEVEADRAARQHLILGHGDRP